MPDAYEHVRKYPLNVVLAALGFETFKYRKAGTEGYGACPIHGSQEHDRGASPRCDPSVSFGLLVFR
jgi:hypothetical protein